MLINIKNSTTTRVIKSIITKNSENLPDMIIDKNISSLSNRVLEKNIINNETTRHTNPKLISISAVKNFDVIIWFLVAGRVCVK